MGHFNKEVIVVNSNSLKINLHKEEWEKVIKENQKLLIDFDAHSKNLNLSNTTRISNFRTILRFGKILKKSFKDVTKEDINKYFLNVKAGDTCKVNYMFTLRKFFRWLNKLGVLDDVKDMKCKKKRLKLSDLLTEEELLKLIDYFRDPCQKALVAVICDTGARRGEIGDLNYKDVKVENGLWSISVSGKTGARNIPLIFSQIYLQEWMEKHPYKKPNAPLWISKCNRLINLPIEKQRLSKNAIWYVVKKGEKYIGKHLYTHLLRHSRLTILASRGLPEYQMRMYAGWEDTNKNR
jgi:site-specific recombinase XerD